MFLGGAFIFSIVLKGVISFDAWLPQDEIAHLEAIRTYSSQGIRGLVMEGLHKEFEMK